MRAVGIAFALVACAAAPGFADAPPSLDAARKDVDNSDYFAARTHLTAALASGAASPDDLAEIYKLTGIVEGALGDDAAAQSAFQKWLDLDARGSLPAGTSPKITRPFDAAAAVVKKRPALRVKTETSADPPAVTLVIASDPDQLIARARVFVRADGGAEQAVDATRFKAELPHGRRLDVRVQGLDRYGNRVIEVGTADVPIVITGGASAGEVRPQPQHEPPPSSHDQPPPPHVQPPPPHDQSSHGDVQTDSSGWPIVAKWYVWGGAAVVAAGVGTYFGLAARSDHTALDGYIANSTAHTYASTQSLATRTNHELIAFDALAIGAGAFAAAAVALYLVEPRATEHLAVAPTSGGGAVVLRGSF